MKIKEDIKGMRMNMPKFLLRSKSVIYPEGREQKHLQTKLRKNVTAIDKSTGKIVDILKDEEVFNYEPN